jgi:hypothetical protein
MRHVDLTASTLEHAPDIVGCARPSPASTFGIENAKVMGFEFAQLGGEPKYLVKARVGRDVLALLRALPAARAAQRARDRLRGTRRTRQSSARSASSSRCAAFDATRGTVERVLC